MPAYLCLYAFLMAIKQYVLDQKANQILLCMTNFSSLSKKGKHQTWM